MIKTAFHKLSFMPVILPIISGKKALTDDKSGNAWRRRNGVKVLCGRIGRVICEGSV